MVTRKDVALKAGVSEGTVSHVITGNVFVKAEKKSKVLAAIAELKYIPNQAARSLVTSRSKHIGIATFETTNPYHMEIAKQIEACAIQKGYMVSLFMLDNNMKDKLRVISERRLDGLVNFMTNQYPEGFITELVAQGTALVNFSADVGSMFTNDYTDATLDILKKVKDLGHKNVAYISTLDEPNFMVDTRGRAWVSGIKDLQFERTAVFYNHDFDKTSDAIGYELATQMISEFKTVTAVLCTNDLAAMGCMRALKDLGYSCPSNVSVIGCDDIALSKIIVPSLTTISVDKTKQGEDIAESIIATIENGTIFTKTYKAKPIYRESLARLT